jgi:hypothetical protein
MTQGTYAIEKDGKYLATLAPIGWDSSPADAYKYNVEAIAGDVARQVGGNVVRMDECVTFGTLIVEDEEGHYEPISDVSTLREAVEIAESDLKRREKILWEDGDPGLCPYEYVIWSRGFDGAFKVAKRIKVETISAGAGMAWALVGVR